ncbi:DUF4397 domain-containing protein [Streptomyces sp. NPDC058685]|uniref:DUF4397 domain-containing protein n=1 Tax=Streptomyces sp. NPDC058685 TaxID=3346598 RepID=UPI003667F3E1
MNSRTPAAVVASLGVCALALGAAAPVGAADRSADQAMVSVFHAVPGLTVDVYANGDELLGDFEPGTLTEPQALAAGSYDLKVFKAGEGPDGTPAIQKTIEVPAGANATVVAHLSADGTPELDAFVNNVSKVPPEKARLTVRHVAAAPAVDVRAGGTPLFTGLVNPREATAEVDPGTVSTDVVLAGTDTVAIGPADLKLAEGTGNVVYAWGSAADKNLALKVQSLDGMRSTPGASAGSPSAMGVTNSSDSWLVWSAAAGITALAGALVLSRRARERA